jgi:hypothetical protein
MIVFTLAAAALAQWTGPHTLEYTGPGYYCGGGYSFRLGKGERALVLPQGQAPQSTRLVLSRGEVNVRTGTRPEAGPVVARYAGTDVTEQADGGSVSYIVADQTNFALRLTSDAFRGFKKDSWFFKAADFSDSADRHGDCLAAVSY